MNGRISSAIAALTLAGGALATFGVWSSALRSEEGRTAGAQNQATRPPRSPLAREGRDVLEYDEKGELKRPVGYETWVFVGSNLGLEYNSDVTKGRSAEETKEKKRPLKGANFHNVYINPEAYAAYMKTGKFPEKTVLILDVFKAEEREKRNIVSEGLFPGARAGMAAAIKNSARPDGAKTDWAYYDFGLEAKTAKAFADKACYDCHLEHADDDNVWVQFYPVLRRVK